MRLLTTLASLLLATATQAGPTNDIKLLNYVPITMHWENGLVSATLATNVVTNWVTVADHRPVMDVTDLAQLQNGVINRWAVMIYDNVDQVGLLITNRVMVVTNQGVASTFVVQELGRDRWPTQQRTLSIPRY